MSQAGYLTFLIVTLPIVVYCGWSDLRHMRIPNKLNILLFAVFVVLGPFFLPLPDYGIRLLQGAGVLAFFFVLNMAGLIGGGDAKLFGAIAPYIAWQSTTVFLFMLSVLAIVSVVLHKLIKVIPPFRRRLSGWASWGEHGKFPFGLPLALSLSAYLLYFYLNSFAF